MITDSYRFSICVQKVFYYLTYLKILQAVQSIALYNFCFGLSAFHVKLNLKSFFLLSYYPLIDYRYFDVLRRKNYVTPTSYLELILTFKSLLSVKRDELMTMKNRYLVGLEKLEFAASQVSLGQT